MNDVDQTYRILESDVCPGFDAILTSYSQGLSPELRRLLEGLREVTEEVLYALAEQSVQP
jgi:hypothetical protein